jgi:hypothetical protein
MSRPSASDGSLTNEARGSVTNVIVVSGFRRTGVQEACASSTASLIALT